MAYILLHAFFVDDAPDSRHQEAAGFIVRPEIQKVLDQEPETTIRDLWKGAEYDPTAVWVPWTVYSVRSVLIFSWFGLFGGLSFVASAFLLLQEKLRVGRGVQPWGDRASAGLSDRGKARQSTVVTTTTPSAPAEPVHGPPRDILGRGQIGLENLKDEETPSLKTAPGVDAGTLFMAVSSPRPSQSTAKTPRGNDVPSRVTPLEIFFCYASRDQRLRNQLETHLSNLKRQNLIAGWHDRKIAPGMEWKGQLDEHLESARIILLLVSADFLASDYCFEVEMRRALERHNAGDARVIPIILRPCDWLTAPFGKLQALPTDLKPITKWSNRDNAFQDVAAGIRKVVEELAQNP